MNHSKLLIEIFICFVLSSSVYGQIETFAPKICDAIRKGRNGLWIKEFFVEIQCDSLVTLTKYQSKYDMTKSSYLSYPLKIEAFKVDLNECRIVPHGFAKLWDENRNLIFKDYRNNGFLTESQFYYSNGKLREICFLDSNRLDGLFTNFHSNGNLKSTGKYENGYKVGFWYYFYPNGELKSYGAYCREKSIINFLDQNRYQLISSRGETKTVNHNLSYKDLIDSLCQELPDLIVHDTIKGIYQVGDIWVYKKVGIWKDYLSNGNIWRQKQYLTDCKIEE